MSSKTKKPLKGTTEKYFPNKLEELRDYNNRIAALRSTEGKSDVQVVIDELEADKLEKELNKRKDIFELLTFAINYNLDVDMINHGRLRPRFPSMAEIRADKANRERMTILNKQYAARV